MFPLYTVILLPLVINCTVPAVQNRSRPPPSPYRGRSLLPPLFSLGFPTRLAKFRLHARASSASSPATEVCHRVFYFNCFFFFYFYYFNQPLIYFIQFSLSGRGGRPGRNVRRLCLSNGRCTE